MTNPDGSEEVEDAAGVVPVPIGVIRVVVIAGPGARTSLAGSPSPRDPISRADPPEHPEHLDLPPPMAVETTAALARLGDPVEILRVRSRVELEHLVADPSIDLVLIDRVETDAMTDWLAAVGTNGPPSVVVIDGASDPADRTALAAFRAGASDCISFGADYDRVLPVVLLEQVRRWRADRQRRLSEERIEWLESLYMGVVSEMPAALALVDRAGLILAVNQEFERLFPARSVVSENEFIEARLPAEIVRAIRSLASARPAADAAGAADSKSSEAALVRVDAAQRGGKARAFELRRRVLEQAEREILLISDVTESEWLSQRLQTVQRDAQGIVDNINSALLVVDPAGRISFANAAAERILGDSVEALGGRRIADWFGRDDDRLSPIEECLERGTRSRGAETLLRRGDGHWIPVGVSCSPRLDAAGRECGVVAVFQDLSEIKELEEQVRQSEKMASIGQLAAGVAHEVNNPMGFIHANLHQMSEYLEDLEKVFQAAERLQTAVELGDPDAIREASAGLRSSASEIDLEYVRSDFRKALGESIEGAERIRHIVKDLRDFSRPDLPERTPADINQALDSTVNIVWAMMKHDVVLEKNYAVLPMIDAYPMQLKQVFMNLLVNAYQAIEARPDGAPGVIRVETEANDEEIVVRISDSGIGMEPAVRARIFEPFFTTKSIGAGTGLGLSTSFSIIERHGGHMQVASRPGEGSCFELTLPANQEKRQAMTETDGQPPENAPVDSPDLFEPRDPHRVAT